MFSVDMWEGPAQCSDDDGGICICVFVLLQVTTGTTAPTARGQCPCVLCLWQPVWPVSNICARLNALVN